MSSALAAKPAVNRLALLVAILATAGLCAWQQWRLWPLFAEDAFIALRYSENLVHGNGLVWNPGEPVEGYSILLWILGCAGLISAGMDPVLASRGLGALCYLASFALMLRFHRPRRLADLPATALAPCVLATAATTATWMMAGLEGPMVVVLVLWASLSTIRLLERDEPPTARALMRTGLIFGLLCLTRSDGPLWLAAPALAVLLRCRACSRGGRAARLLALGAPAVTLLVAQVLFRRAYYGDWLPNTAHLKIDPSWSTVQEGLIYIGEAFASARGAAALALLGVVAGVVTPGRRLRTLVLALSIPLWSTYLTIIGGDYFPSHRLFVPVIPVLGLLAADGIAWLSQRRHGSLAAAALTVGCLALLGHDAVADRQTAGLRDAGLEWKNVALGRTLRGAFAAQQPLLAVDAAGGIPFASRLPAVDMLGFNDRTIARTPIAPFVFEAVQRILGRTYLPGHMHGNGGYVLDRQPDIILFHNAPCMIMPVFASGYEMQTDPRFLTGYRCIQLQCAPERLPNGMTVAMRASVWLRLEGRVGVQRSEDRIEVPGYLLGSYRQPRPFQLLHAPTDPAERAAFDSDYRGAYVWAASTAVIAVPIPGGLAGELVGHGPGTLGPLQVPAGRWRLEVEPATAPVIARVVDPAGAVVGSGAGVFELPSAAELELSVQATIGAAHPVAVHRVAIIRAR